MSCIFSTDLSQKFGSNVCNELEFCWEEKNSNAKNCIRNCPHTFSHDIHQLDWVKFCWQYNGSIAALPFLHFQTKIWRHYNSQAVYKLSDISNLKFRPLLKTPLSSIHLDLRDTSGEKIHFVTVGITRLVLMFRKLPIFIFNENHVTRWLLQHN